MRLLKLWEVPLCLLPLVIAPAGAQALAVNIQINGTTVPSGNCSTVGNTTTCNIEGTYGSVQVSHYPDGTTAQVVAVDDASLPILKLINAKFMATANAVNGSVSFSTTPTAGINGPKMQRVASGWLVRVEGSKAAYTSSTNRGQFIVDGVVINGAMSPTNESIDGLSNGGVTGGSSKVVLSSVWSYGEINATLFTKNETMSQLSGSRTLKGQFTFYLPAANDYLRLSEVRVETLNPGTGETDPASVGYTDIWDDDTGKCKCKGKECMKKLCPGPDCPKLKGKIDKKP